MHTWFRKRGAPELRDGHLVAYFCAEYGITDDLPIYSGGLGVLAGDIVQEAALRRLPFIAVGLFYRKGYFHQFVDSAGQHELPVLTDPLKVPLQLAVDDAGETILIEVPIQERIVYAQLWRFQVGDNSLLLLDTDHWKNSDADKAITDQLYSGGTEKRIEQELVLGIGGFRALQRLGLSPTLYHMNEGHSAFLALELTRTLLAKHNGNGDSAHAEAKQMLVYTNHTLVPAGNDAFPEDIIRSYLGKYAYESGLSIERVLGLGSAPDSPGKFSMPMLALRSTRAANAVSKLHAKKARNLWPDYKLLPITNGVHLPAWVAPEWQQLWDQYIPEWRSHTGDASVYKNLRKVPPTEVWATHQQLKRKLLDEVYAREGVQLDEDALTVVWARRFATYKRPDLLFSDIEKLKALLFNEDRPVQVIIAGKSHPADGQGKEIIKHIEYLSNYALKRRAVFVDDYNITLARTLVAGADIWLNTPIFGLEASGTSGMKAASNGAIQFTTPDGWAWEVDWFGRGFTLPVEHAETRIYDLFSRRILPAYYGYRDRHNIPRQWVDMMVETMRTVAPNYSSTRMVCDYVDKMYKLP
jgi:starch phosphorylase